MCLFTFFLQANPASFEYLLNHPLISIGALVLAVGFLQIGSKLMKWIEHSIKDNFFRNILILLSIVGLVFLLLAIVFQFKEN